MKKEKKSKWEWYAVKMLFENIIFGEPNPDKLDANYNSESKIYMERIVLVRAQSKEHAFRIADSNAGKYEREYNNRYDQLIICKFIALIDCFHVEQGQIRTGTDVYSRFISAPLQEKTENIIKTLFPEFSTCRGEKNNTFKTITYND